MGLYQYVLESDVIYILLFQQLSWNKLPDANPQNWNNALHLYMCGMRKMLWYIGSNRLKVLVILGLFVALVQFPRVKYKIRNIRREIQWHNPSKECTKMVMPFAKSTNCRYVLLYSYNCFIVSTIGLIYILVRPTQCDFLTIISITYYNDGPN